MLCRALLPFALVTLSGAALAPAALAQSSKLSVPQAGRPLTLPRATLRFDGGPRWPMPDGQLAVMAGDVEEAVFVNLGLAAGFTDRLQAGLLALPMRLAPHTDVFNPLLYLLYALTEGPTQVGLFASLAIPVEGDLVLTAGVPLRVRLGDAARLDLGALLRLDVDPADASLLFPLEVAFDVSEGFFLGPEVGVFFPRLDDVAVPVGFFLGPSFTRGDRLVGDLRLGARWLDVTNDFDVILIYARAELFFDV